MIDFARQRRTMVDTQIRVNDVTDARIVQAFLDVPREIFVPEHKRALAYIDADAEVSAPAAGRPARHLIETVILAKLIQAADIGPSDLALDVGSATGYSAAVIGRLVGGVVALEEDAELSATAARALAEVGAANVAMVDGRLAEGAAKFAPYDAIVLQGAVEIVPEALLAQLKEGGRLVAVVGAGRAAKAMVFTRVGGAISRRAAFDAALPPLPGFAATPQFVF